MKSKQQELELELERMFKEHGILKVVQTMTEMINNKRGAESEARDAIWYISNH